MNPTDETARFRIPCRHLRNKEMYYNAPDDDAYASGAFWCARTHECFGPDGQAADKADCREGRSCYLS